MLSFSFCAYFTSGSSTFGVCFLSKRNLILAERFVWFFCILRLNFLFTVSWSLDVPTGIRLLLSVVKWMQEISQWVQNEVLMLQEKVQMCFWVWCFHATMPLFCVQSQWTNIWNESWIILVLLLTWLYWFLFCWNWHSQLYLFFPLEKQA